MIDDVKALLDKHNIKYFERGDSIQCLCLNPTHNDKHIGSFSISKSKKLAHCYSCGFSANIYQLNKILGETVYGSSSFHKSAVFEKSVRPIKKEEPIYPKPLVYGKLKNPFENQQVLNFLHSIGYSDDFIESKGIQYCTYCEMIAEGYEFDEEVKPTKMINRIVIPIYHKGNLINYECRTFDGSEPKVKYVTHCSVQTLYNWDNIDINKPVIVTEGIKNLGNLWNITHNVISMFHAIPTEYQMEMLNKCKYLVVYCDNDAGSFGEVKDGKLRKGTVQYLDENYNGDFKICWDNRTYKKFNSDGELVIKGYDCADCTIEENRSHLAHAIWYSDFKNKNKTKEKITW